MASPIEIPAEGLDGIEALLALGSKGLTTLAQKIAGQKPTLELSALVRQWAPDLKVSRPTLRKAILSALMPLNQTRAAARYEAERFLAGVTESLEGQAPPEWQEQHLARWRELLPQLRPLFEPDNLFSLMSSGFALLAGRQATLLDLRIAAELRPVYNEEGTKTRALLLTHTLVLEYVQDEQTCTLYLALDANDLQGLAREHARAKRQTGVALKEAKGWKVDVLTYGEEGD